MVFTIRKKGLKMPIYEYKCKTCNYEFEELQSITAASLTTCPKCNNESLVRLISGGNGLIFKGGGFYITDYKNKRGNSSNGGSSKTKATPPEKEAVPSNDS